MKPESHIVVITASAGGLNAISEILSRLPSNFPAPIAIAQHLDPKRPSMMAEILDRRFAIICKASASRG